MFARNRQVQVLSLKNQTLIADKCVEANSFLARLRGLIGRRKMLQGEGMLFPRCNDIHTWFMSLSIDVLFLSRDGRESEFVVVAAHPGVRAWRILPLRDGRASETLELSAGTIERFEIREGDRLCIV